jgi:hypothetical protein
MTIAYGQPVVQPSRNSTSRAAIRCVSAAMSSLRVGCNVFATSRLQCLRVSAGSPRILPRETGEGDHAQHGGGGVRGTDSAILSGALLSAQSIRREGGRAAKPPPPPFGRSRSPATRGRMKSAAYWDQPKRQSVKASVSQGVSQSAAAYWPTRSEGLVRLLAASGSNPEATVGSGGLSRRSTTTRRAISP